MQVGDSKLHYTFTQSSPYYFDLVVANGAVPIDSVEISIGGQWIMLSRANNNVYPYYNSNGAYSFPLDVRITPVCGPAVCFSATPQCLLEVRTYCASSSGRHLFLRSAACWTVPTCLSTFTTGDRYHSRHLGWLWDCCL